MDAGGIDREGYEGGAGMSPWTASRRIDAEAVPWLVSGFGVLSFGSVVGWTVWFRSVLETVAVGLGIVTVAFPALTLVWAGYRLDRNSIDPVRYGRIVAWCGGCAVGFLAINGVVILAYPWPSLAGNVAWAHFSINAGAVAGFGVGYVEARAIQRAADTAAAAARAERLEDERELLTYLNDLLRHEVLNSAQIVGGHASVLLADAEGRRREHLETIERESEALTDVIDDVRAMVNASRDRTDAVVDLADVLETELTALQRRFDDVDVTATTPESAPVEGNEGVRYIFENVLENAVVHNEGDRARVDVTVETTPETVVTRIGDDGPGIPAERRDRLFERKSADHGLGLYLVRILTTRYGGCVALTDTGPGGSVVTVWLPRASVPGATDPGDDERERVRSATASPREDGTGVR